MSTEGKQWEEVPVEREVNVFVTTDRLSVEGGWIYRTIVTFRDCGPGISTVFVPFARFSGAEMEGRLATSPHSPANAPRPASEIPDFSAPAPKGRS